MNKMVHLSRMTVKVKVIFQDDASGSTVNQRELALSRCSSDLILCLLKSLAMFPVSL